MARATTAQDSSSRQAAILMCGLQVLDPHPDLTVCPRLIKTVTGALGFWGMSLPHCPLKLQYTMVTLSPLMEKLEASHASIAVLSTHQSHILAQELEMSQVLASSGVF